MSSPLKNLDNIIETNEQELYSLQKAKIQKLEKYLTLKEQAFKELNLKFQDLSQDFNYNLDVINQRDNEIEEMTEKLIQLKKICDIQKNENETLLKQLQNSQSTQRRELNECYDKLDQNKSELRYQKRKHEEQLKELNEKLENKELEHQNLILKFDELLTKNEIKMKDLENYQQQKLENELKRIQDEAQQIYQQTQNENEQLRMELGEMSTENQELKTKIKKDQLNINQQNQDFNQETQQYKLKIQQQNLMIEQLKDNNRTMKSDFDTFEKKLVEKLELTIAEKEKAILSLQEIKLAKKSKLKQQKENYQRRILEIQREADERLRKFEQEKTFNSLDIEKLSYENKNQKEKLIEFETRSKREIQEMEQKYIQITRNLEQDKRQSVNELETKVFQYNQLQKENTRLEDIIKQMNKVIDALQKKLADIGNENKVLIEEVVKLRKNNLSPKQSSARQHNFQAQPNEKQKFQSKNLKDSAESRSPVKPQLKKQYLADEEEVESYEKLFSEDEGPAVAFNVSERQQRKLNISMSRIRNLENENTQLKNVIDEITKDMEQAKNKLVTNAFENNILRQENLHSKERIQSLQNEILFLKEKNLEMQQNLIQLQQKGQEIIKIEEKLKEKEQTVLKTEENLHVLEKKNTHLRQQVSDLKNEREQLLEITNELNFRIRDNDDQIEYYKDQYRKIQEDMTLLTQELTLLQKKKLEEHLPQNKEERASLSEIQHLLYKQGTKNQTLATIQRK